MSGGVGVLGYMLYGIKNKPKDMRLSVYMIHTRMYVQGTVIIALTVGMAAQIYK